MDEFYITLPSWCLKELTFSCVFDTAHWFRGAVVSGPNSFLNITHSLRFLRTSYVVSVHFQVWMTDIKVVWEWLYILAKFLRTLLKNSFDIFLLTGFNLEISIQQNTLMFKVFPNVFWRIPFRKPSGIFLRTFQECLDISSENAAALLLKLSLLHNHSYSVCQLDSLVKFFHH